MPKAPSFPFYPADWLNNMKLQSCSLTAQGLFINLMCLMHQSKRYGYLLINGHAPTDKTLIKLLRIHHKTFDKHIKELLDKGVIKQDENGVYYCKRMHKDQMVRKKRWVAGKKGGNPNLVNQKVNHEVNLDDEKCKPLSFSSSFSSIKDLSKDKSPGGGSSKKHFKLKAGQYLQGILQACQKIMTFKADRHRRFKPYQWVQHQFNNNAHPGAVCDVLNSLIKYWNTTNDHWGYAEAVMKTVNQNWNEKDSIKEHEEIKTMWEELLTESGVMRKLTGKIGK